METNLNRISTSAAASLTLQGLVSMLRPIITRHVSHLHYGSGTSLSFLYHRVMLPLGLHRPSTFVLNAIGVPRELAIRGHRFPPEARFARGVVAQMWREELAYARSRHSTFPTLSV